MTRLRVKHVLTDVAEPVLTCDDATVMSPHRGQASNEHESGHPVGIAIGALMGAHRISQRELANRSGVSQSTISRNLDEPWKFTVDQLDCIGAVFGVDPADFWHPERVVEPEKFKLLRGMLKGTTQRQLPGIGGPDLRVLKGDD